MTAIPCFLAHFPSAVAYQNIAGTPVGPTRAMASEYFASSAIAAANSGEAASIARSPHRTPRSRASR